MKTVIYESLPRHILSRNKLDEEARGSFSLSEKRLNEFYKVEYVYHQEEKITKDQHAVVMALYVQDMYGNTVRTVVGHGPADIETWVHFCKEAHIRNVVRNVDTIKVELPFVK